jgi:CheY-like chemotaxis protein
VRDTGIGIAPEQLEKLFDMFVQADTTLERATSGLGIGLSLVKDLAEMHGGAVEVRSAGLRAGSEFIVRLPQIPEPAALPAGTPKDNGSVAKTNGEKPAELRRVLVVDDNVDSAEALAMILKIKGNEVQIAYDGLEAVELANVFRPNAIILDIGLPRLNGYEAAREIRRQEWGSETVLIALTGWGQQEDRQRSKDAGFDSHMVKPVDYERLIKQLDELAPARSSAAGNV